MFTAKIPDKLTSGAKMRFARLTDNMPSLEVLRATMTSKPARSSDTFTFPRDYTFPPFWSIQPTFATRQDQFQKWSSLIQAYCRQKRILRLMLVDALNTPLFHNAQLRKRLTLLEAREIVDWMTREEGDKRAEWIGKESERGSAWIYWKRPEEWAEAFSSWVFVTTAWC